jgi:hypothetical protein
MLIASTQQNQHSSRRIVCISNLRQIGIWSRVWSNDHGDEWPASNVSAETDAGADCWVFYSTMSNESILTCPADERRPVTDFEVLKDNSHLSYFVGVQGSYPQAIVGGDRNLGTGNVPDPEYGFSPTNGMGNDVLVKGPVCWSLKMHSGGNPAGAGNILLGDGSGQEVSSQNLTLYWLNPALQNGRTQGTTSNAVGIRLIFP